MGDNTLFFEILTDRRHFFLEAKDTEPVRKLHERLRPFVSVPERAMILYKMESDGSKTRLPPNDLLMRWFGPSTALAYAPAQIGFEAPDVAPFNITPMSQPPPLAGLPPTS